MSDEVGADGDYLDHWTNEDIAAWEAKSPELLYQSKGLPIQFSKAVKDWEREWDRRIGTPFPGFNSAALEEVAAAARIPFAVYKKLSGGEIYRLAIEALDSQPPAKEPPRREQPIVQISPQAATIEWRGIRHPRTTRRC